MNEIKIKAEYEELQERIKEIGLPIPGTIHELYSRCGSPTCPCAVDDTKRHGPYLRWHHKIRGHQYALGITEEMTPVIKRGIVNREKLEKLVNDMLEIGAEHIKNFSVKKKQALEKSEKM